MSSITLDGIYNQYGVDGGSETAANDLSAAITRQQFDDYQARFSPYLSKLNGMVSDDAIAQQQKDWTNQIMGQNTQQQGFGMSMRNQQRYGGAIDQRAQGFGLRQSAIDDAANKVSQVNQMNNDVKDRAMVLMSGQKLSANQ
jgi:hypothetical protein